MTGTLWFSVSPCLLKYGVPNCRYFCHVTNFNCWSSFKYIPNSTLIGWTQRLPRNFCPPSQRDMTGSLRRPLEEHHRIITWKLDIDSPDRYWEICMTIMIQRKRRSCVIAKVTTYASRFEEQLGAMFASLSRLL